MLLLLAWLVRAADATAADDGLKLYLPFDESAGATVCDAASPSRTGAVSGQAAWTREAVRDGALRFDGQSTWLRVDDTQAFGISNALTVVFWARNDDQPISGARTLFALRDAGAREDRLLTVRWSYDENHLQILRRNPADTQLWSQYFRVGDSAGFDCYAVVFADRQVSVYKAGELVGRATNAPPLSELPKQQLVTLIGAEWTRPRYLFKGVLDEFRVYDRPLTQETLRTLFHQTPFNAYPNKVRNAGFEIAVLPDWPDFWYSRRGLLQRPVPSDVFLDHRVTHGGTNAMRFDILAPVAEASARVQLQESFKFIGGVEPGDYVLSAWLKSDPPGLRMDMDLRGQAKGAFVLTNRWERHWIKVAVSNYYEGSVRFRPATGCATGSIWLDDVMLARGTRPLPDALSPRDARPDTAGDTSTLVAPIPPVTADWAGARLAPEAPPRIDGALDDACWRQAPPPVVLVQPSGQPARRATRAQFRYDDQALYVAVVCDDPAAATRNPGRYPHDDRRMWNDDVVELFVDTDGRDEVYHQLALSAGGSRWDCRSRFQADTVGSDVFQRDDTLDWDGPWTAAVLPTPTGWQAEIVVPWCLFSQDLNDPADFRVNLARIAPAAPNMPEETSCWSPTLGPFNSPWRFARIRNLQVEWSPYRIWIEDADVLPLPGGSGCRLQLAGRNGDSQPRDCRVLLRASGSDGWQTAGEAKDVAPGGTFRIETPLRDVASATVVTAELQVVEGDAVRSTSTVKRRPEPGMTLLVGDRAVAGQPLRAPLRLNFPADTLKRCTVNLTLRPEGVPDRTAAPALADQTLPAQHGLVVTDLATAGTAAGRVTLRAELRRRRQVLATAETTLTLLPAGTRLVTVDRQRGLLLDGSPFLPITMYGESGNMPDLPDLVAHGCNTLLWRLMPDDFGTTDERLREAAAAIARPGLRIIPDFTDLTRRKFDAGVPAESCITQRLATIRRIVTALKDNPAVIAWHTLDEPEVRAQMGTPAILRRLYETVRAADPARPVIVNLGTGGLHKRHAPDASDVVMYDFYTWPLAPDRRPLEKCIENLSIARDWCEDTDRALFSFVESDPGAGPTLARNLTPDELRCRLYLELVMGTRGLFFWAGPPDSSVLWDSFGQYAAEMAALNPALSTPSTRLTVVPDDAAVKCYAGEQEGDVVVIAVNTTHLPRTVRLDLRTRAALPESADVRFETRSVTLRDGALTDRFEGYGVHVYRIRPRQE